MGNGDTNVPFYLNVQTEMIAPFSVIYMRRTGAYGPENHKLMERMKRWIKESGLYHEQTVILGISWDDPSVINAGKCRYDVGIVCEKQVPAYLDDIGREQMHGGCYVVFLIEHTVEAVQMAWKQCFSVLVDLGFTFDRTRPIMERYQKKLVDRHCCELCVPIINIDK